MNVKIAIQVLAFALVILSACGEKGKSEASSPSVRSIDGAFSSLDAKIAAEPDNAEWWAARGELYYENEGYDEAIRDLEQAIAIDSSRAEYYHLLADVYLDYFRSRNALRTMEKAAERFPRRIPTLLKLSEFQLILQQHEASMRTLDRILRIDPQNAEAFFMFGLNFKESGDTARAINSFQKAAEIEPELIDAWINLGQLHAALGHAIAGRYFDSALEIQPGNVAVMHAKADYLSDQDRLEEAIEVYREIIAINPRYAEAHYNAGLLYMELDSVAAARRQFDLALKISPLHIRAYYFRGLAAEMLGRGSEALADYQQALRLAPDYELAREGLERLRKTQ
jgi:tetratricopeptide (TPR) repeat protein